MWSFMIEEGKKFNVNVREFLDKHGLKGRKPSAADLPKLIPLLNKVIEEKESEIGA